MKKIILASQSIDRGELLRRCNLKFEILVSNIDEGHYKQKITDPVQLVKTLAEVKALKAKSMLKDKPKEALIIAADTIVEYQGNVIGKPKNREQAFQTLKNLTGKAHSLITGIAITETAEEKIIIDFDETKVHFLPLSDKEIWGYVATNEWKGRAGAYSIRDKASLFIESIEGSTSNVIGLPMHKIFQILKRDFNLNLFND